MGRYRHILLTLLFIVSASLHLKAQENGATLGLRAGHNAAFGGYAAVSVEAKQQLAESFAIQGGAQYSSIGKATAEARPSYFHDFCWGRISAEVLIAYTRMASVNSYAAGAGAVISGIWVSGKLGYYYHSFGGKGGHINEPFNIYYELSANLLPMIDEWDLKLTITNCEIFELERHYQPSFSASCSYFPRHDIGVHLGIGCKPSGMFHLSADYYESYLKLGVCYRW